MTIQFFDYHMMDEQPTFIEEYETSEEICKHLEFVWHSLPHLRQDGMIGGRIVNKEVKDSVDLFFNTDNFSLIQSYVDHIIEITNQYVQKYFVEVGINIGTYGIEMLNIQHYNPGGGFKRWHCERASFSNTNRFLTFMTYLTDTPDGGTEFLYQNKKFECVRGKTLIWPTDFTHTHRGTISKEHEKMVATGWVVFFNNSSKDIEFQ